MVVATAPSPAVRTMAARRVGSTISSPATTRPIRWASSRRTAVPILCTTALSSITASRSCRTSWTRTAASPPSSAPPATCSRFRNQRGLQPSGLDGIVGLGPVDPASGTNVLNVNGQTAFLSDNLDERQREITHYGIVSYLHSQGAFDFQISAFGRYSSLFFTPDAVGDLLYNGISQTAYKRDEAYGLQAEGA